MMQTINVRSILCALTGGLISILPVTADEHDSLSTRQIRLNEVIVHSAKYDGSMQTHPVAASTLDRRSLQHRNVTGIKDVSAFIPNLFIPDYGSRLTSPVYIRGIGSKINAPSVGLYVDGIPFFEKSAFDFDFNEIDRIEVLRGPQGTLFGRNTMGGLINVSTRSPLHHQGTSVSVSGGSYAALNASAAHYGKIDPSFGYALSGNYLHSGGYFTNQSTGRKADPIDAGSGRIRLDRQIHPRLLLKLTLLLDRSVQGGYPYAAVDSTGKTGQVNYNEYSSYRRTLSSSGFTLHYTAPRFSLNSQTAFQHLSDRQGIDQDFSPASAYFAVQNQRQSTLSHEVTLKSVPPHAYQWLIGAFAFHQQVDNEVILYYRTLDYHTRQQFHIPTSGLSFYHQSVFNLRPLSLTLGLRYDYEKATNHYLAYKNTAERQEQTGAFDSRMAFSRLTPKAALQYTFPNRRMLYASVANGYKTGGFNASFSVDEDRTFEPEYSWNYELGAKGSFFQNRLQAELCLFYIDWRNQQVARRLPDGRGSVLKNAGHSESRGVETSIHANPFNGLILSAHWGYTHAVFREYKPDETLDYAGKRLPMVPLYTFTPDATYKIPLLTSLPDQILLNLHYTATGRLYWLEDNRAAQPAYGLLNGKITLSKRNAQFALWAKNLLNAQYTSFYFEALGGKYAQQGRPFTLGASVTLSL